jgi:glycosyltransferase involved in cell wall biosynthesis
LAKAGYEVHLLATGKETQTYEDKGVIIHPLPESGSRRQRYTRASRVAQLAADLKPDLFHVHEPDLLNPVIARAGTRPVIYDVHESFLDIVKESQWLPFWAKPLACLAWDQWERQLVRRCAGIVVVTERIAERYSSLQPNVRVVANFPDCQNLDDSTSIARDSGTCVFAGGLTRSRGLSQIFEAMAILKHRDVEIRLALAGPSISDEYLRSLWAEAGRLGIGPQVHYHGLLSRSQALTLQSQASIGLVTYLPLQYSITGLPNKLMECMALGLPVVCSDFPVYREVAGTTGAGILVDPTRPEQIAGAIESIVQDPVLANRMGEAGRLAVRERFNWNVERTKLLQLYRQILGPSSHSGSLNAKSCDEVLHEPSL